MILNSCKVSRDDFMPREMPILSLPTSGVFEVMCTVRCYELRRVREDRETNAEMHICSAQEA